MHLTPLTQRSKALALKVCVPLLLAPTAAGQFLISSGDSLGTLGTVTEVLEVTVNGSGAWAATVRTTGMAANENALVVDGEVRIAPSDALPGGGLAETFQAAESPVIDSAGRVAWRGLGRNAQGLTVATGLFLDLTPLAKTGTPVTASGFTASENWSLSFAHTLIPGGGLAFRARTSPSDGALLWRADEIAAGEFEITYLDDAVFAGSRNNLAADGQGRIVYAKQNDLRRDGELIASNFGPSPIFGVQYGTFSTSAVAAAGPANVAFLNRANVPDNRWMLVWNGQLLARQGESLSAIAPFTLTSLIPGAGQAGPLSMSTAGRLLWWGSWNDPDPALGEGLFLDQQPLVRVGDTEILGRRVIGLVSGTGPAARTSFQLAPNGKFFVFRALFEGGDWAAVRVELDQEVEFIAPCSDYDVWLCTSPSGSPLGCVLVFPKSIKPGGTLPLGFRVPSQPLGAFEYFNPSTVGQVYIGERTSTVCGLPLPGLGEVMLDLGQPFGLLSNTTVVFPGFWATVTVPIPDVSELIGVEFTVQGVLLNPTSSLAPVRITNALGVRIALFL